MPVANVKNLRDASVSLLVLWLALLEFQDAFILREYWPQCVAAPFWLKINHNVIGHYRRVHPALQASTTDTRPQYTPQSCLRASKEDPMPLFLVTSLKKDSSDWCTSFFSQVCAFPPGLHPGGAFLHSGESRCRAQSNRVSTYEWLTPSKVWLVFPEARTKSSTSHHRRLP